MIDIQNKSFSGLKFVDLFAGIGGFHLALSSFGAECVFASEIDYDASRVYEANHGIKPKGDITKISAEDVPSHDILCAGFPCQAFSTAGYGAGFADTRGTLFNEVVRIAKHHMPKIVFMENVKNLVSHDGGRTFKVIRQAFVEIGYDFYYKTLNVKDFGVPQNRERVYMVAIRKDCKLTEPFVFPSCRIRRSLRSVLLSGIPKGALVTHTSRVLLYNSKRSEYPQNGIERVGEMRLVNGFPSGGRQGERVIGINGVSPTLTTSTSERYLMDDGTIRTLGTRELARLQGFPDTFKIHAKKSIAAKQFGNSVCVDVLQFILTELSYSLGLET